MKKTVFLLLFMTMFLNIFSMDKILILNSYGEDFQWTSDEVDGILEGLGNRKENNEIYIEYMDWKKEFGDNQYNILKEIYLLKYQSAKPKIIITTDNIAYTMAKELRKNLFKNNEIPIIFCGINGIKEGFVYEEANCAGVSEVLSIEENILLISNLHKNLEKIYIINDKSETGVATKQEIQKIKSIEESNIKIEYLDMKSLADFKWQLSKIKGNAVILQGISTMYGDGKNSSYANTLKVILENSHVPVYSFWTFLLNKGIVGGKLLDGKENGFMAGEIAYRVLNGEKTKNIGVIEKDVNKYIFDNNQLLKYNLNTKKLYKEAIIINKKSSIFQKEYILIFVLFIILILILIIIIFLLVRKIKKIQFNQKNIEIQKAE